MLLVIASAATALFAAPCSLASDPSLVVPHANYYMTLMDVLPEVVLDDDGIYLTWDEEMYEFSSLEVDSVSATNLETASEPSGEISFTGTLSGNTVEGLVGPGASPSTYYVYLTLPGEVPVRYEVLHSGSGVAINVGLCECSDGVDLTCKSKDCRLNRTCPQSGGSTSCAFQPV